jgi:hypothetical protein
MNTFPLRVTRSQLGPRMRNNRPVENPETDVGEDMINGLLDQAAGCNITVARVSLVAKRNGGSFDIFHQAEAWNTDESQPHPVLAIDPDVATAGRYIYTFASTYLNGDNEPITTVLPGLRVHTFGAPASDAAPYTDRTSARAWLKPSNPLIVKIAVFDAAGAPIDAPFGLEAL